VVLAETDPLQTTASYAYDERGQQISQTDTLNHTTRFEYDALGRRSKRILPDAIRDETWTYDYLAAGDPTPPTGKKQNKLNHLDFGSRLAIIQKSHSKLAVVPSSKIDIALFR